MSSRPHILVLGSGLVVRPMLHYLLSLDYRLTLASNEPQRAASLVEGYPNATTTMLLVEDEAALSDLIASADLVISLVPAALHPQVAKVCVQHRKSLVTASYIAPEMQALDAAAKEAGVLLLNELGLDPGIDHMSAMRIIHDVKQRSGRVTSFRSYCGGLPAQAANTNPFGYKFSWAPRGVLLASRNGARYLKDGQLVNIPPERLFRDMHLLHVPGAGDFEAYPNRDSLGYIEVYGLEGIQTMLRATLRNIGWSDCMYHYRQLGLLDLNTIDPRGQSCASFLTSLVGEGANLAAATAQRLGIPLGSLPIHNLQWLGMFDALPITATTPLDVLAERMLQKLVFTEGEQDMVVLFHEFRAEFSDGHRERITSQLVACGDALNASAMSRTVSLPVAIAADLILKGQITTLGVQRPVLRDIYQPILTTLETMDIECRETTEWI